MEHTTEDSALSLSLTPGEYIWRVSAIADDGTFVSSLWSDVFSVGDSLESIVSNFSPVSALNDISGNVSLLAGQNINITSSGQNLTISTVGQATISSLVDLTDVNTTMSPAAGDGLVWNGAEWTSSGIESQIQNGTTLDLGTGKVLYSNVYQTLAELPAAANYHGMFAHVHNYDGLGTGAAFYAHAGNWVRLADSDSVPSLLVSSVNGLSGQVSLAAGANTQISQSGNQLTISSSPSLTTVNGESGELSLVGGTGVSVTTADGVISVSSTQYTAVNSLTGEIGIVAGDNINVTTSGQNVVISGEQGGIVWSTPPQSGSSPGNAGDIAYDDNFLYLRTSQAWRQVALSPISTSITISQQPSNQSVDDGSTATFTVLATAGGESIAYQWEQSADNGSTFSDISGATSNSLTVTANLTLDGYQYRASLSAPGADDVTTSVATLTVGETFDLLAENGDRLMTEGGDSLDHDGVGGGVAAWTQVGADIDGEAAGDASGRSVAMSSDGSRVAIGAYVNDGTGADAGHVRVYDLVGSTWTQVGADIDGEAAGDYSGWPVAMSSDGSRVAIGAYVNDGTGTGAGHVRVYELVNSTWTQVGADIDGEAAGDYSGASVAMSSDGGRVAIGASRNDGTGTDAGHVRVYDLVGSTWTQVGADIDGEAADDRSGYSVAMSSDGSRVAIGANLNDGTGNNAGHVRVYDLVGSTWTQVGADIDGEAADDRSGYSVAMSSDGSRVAIGAPYNDGTGTDAGHVRVYDLIGSTWTQVGADIDGEAANDYSGISVAMSSDGSRVAIGASHNGVAGTDAGHVRVYDLIGSTWTQVGADIDGEAVNDFSGASVAMSSDGSRVAIGATGNDGTGSNAGHVRVYDWT